MKSFIVGNDIACVWQLLSELDNKIKPNICSHVCFPTIAHCLWHTDYIRFTLGRWRRISVTHPHTSTGGQTRPDRNSSEAELICPRQASQAEDWGTWFSFSFSEPQHILFTHIIESFVCNQVLFPQHTQLELYVRGNVCSHEAKLVPLGDSLRDSMHREIQLFSTISLTRLMKSPGLRWGYYYTAVCHDNLTHCGEIQCACILG